MFLPQFEGRKSLWFVPAASSIAFHSAVLVLMDSAGASVFQAKGAAVRCRQGIFGWSVKVQFRFHGEEGNAVQFSYGKKRFKFLELAKCGKPADFAEAAHARLLNLANRELKVLPLRAIVTLSEQSYERTGLHPRRRTH